MPAVSASAFSRLNLRNVSVGAAFGLALEKAKVYVPDIIIGQMLLRKFTMSQMFLTATASGMYACSSVRMVARGLLSYPPHLFRLVIAILDSTGIKKRACKPPVSL